jgi:hypothetical protein
MALDERRRQQKLAKKNAKRKKNVVAVTRKAISHVVNLMNDPTTVAIAARASMAHDCYVSKQLFEMGMGNVVISRLLPDGRIAMAAFLLDVYCLGIKNVFARAMSPEEFRQHIKLLERNEVLHKKDSSYARKLVESAESWAASFGLTAHPDYRVAKQLFSDIDATACEEIFTFGKEGKPLFINGPGDSPAKIRQVLETLSRTCGEGNFETMLVGSAGV